MKSKQTILRRMLSAPGLLMAAFCVALMAGSAAAETVKIPHTPEMYKDTPVALQPVQCGQCHVVQFKNLQDDGRKHQFACQNCHTKFHAYNPRKSNYDAIMPQCKNCHLTPPHGDKFLDCLTCHSNPHTPRSVALNKHLEENCGNCHTEEGQQLQQFPSKHTEQGCTACHANKHGVIPTCFNCHEPHIPGQTFEDCKTCHNPHKPLQIMFHGEETKVDTCQACHEEVYGKWSHTPSKHGTVNCTRCHVAHGKIPECTMCHGLPHSEALHKLTPRCLDCHLDVHNLPIKQK